MFHNRLHYSEPITTFKLEISERPENHPQRWPWCARHCTVAGCIQAGCRPNTEGVTSCDLPLLWEGFQSVRAASQPTEWAGLTFVGEPQAAQLPMATSGWCWNMAMTVMTNIVLFCGWFHSTALGVLAGHIVSAQLDAHYDCMSALGCPITLNEMDARRGALGFVVKLLVK